MIDMNNQQYLDILILKEEKNSLSFEAETILVQINGKEDLYANI